MTPTYSFKVALLGHQAVGKTSIVTRYTRNMFPKRYLPSIGADFFIKEMNCSSTGDVINMYIWDIAGQVAFEKMFPSYLKGTVIGLVVFDITRRDTFDDLDYWVGMLNRHGAPGAKCIVIGNKIDLHDARVIDAGDARRKAGEIAAVDYFETSALVPSGIDETFTACLDVIKPLIDGPSPG